MSFVKQRHCWTMVARNVLLAGAVAVGSTTILAKESEGIEVMQKQFRNPPDDARIMMRWWWFGPAVTKPELARELQAMKAAGIGGVEIQAVYPLALDDPATGIQNLPFLSAGHLDALKYANEQARALGLRVDLTLGSGWPYGGPSVPIEQAAGQLRVERAKLLGGQQMVAIPRLEKGERLEAVFLAQENGGAIEPTGTREVTDVKDGKVQVPTDLGGANELLFFISSHTKQLVKRASVGAEGLVLDHYSRQATEAYLKQVGEPLIRAFGDKPPYAIFCDSFECFESDWTPDFLAEFKKRRGYDLKPFLPALVGDFGPKTADIRRDWGHTLTELLNERFVQPLREWAAKHGTRLRLQGYGIPPATVSTSQFADLPEGEGAAWKTLCPSRWASSTCHLYSRPVTSSETWTWLHSPSFRATPLDMKAEADLHFLQGINQIIGHGWPYSGPASDYPGWRLYAAGAFNDKNPWWIVMPELSRYLQRVSFALRLGRPANDVATYLPNNDVWAQFRNKEVHMIDLLRKRIGDDVVSKTLEAGYNLDFFDDDALREVGKVEDGKLALGDGEHRVVILPNVERIPVETLRTLEEFVKRGGSLIATRRLPDKAPDGKTEEVQAAVQRLFQGADAPAHFVADEKRDLFGELRKSLPPAVDFAGGDKNLGFVHRRTPDTDLFFVANTAPEPRKMAATFRVDGLHAESWDPVTGEELPFTKATGKAGAVTLPLELAPYESRVVVFSQHGTPNVVEKAPIESALDVAPIDLSSDWRVSFDKGASLTMAKLRSWTDDEATKHFSGVATYEKEFSLPPGYIASDSHVLLDLGPAKSLGAKKLKNGMRAWIDAPVQEAAVVYINGQNAGGVWRPPYQVDVTRFLKPGKNQVKLVVGNTAINALSGQRLPDYKALNQKYGERFKPQDMENLQPLPSGLTGPIQLQRANSSL